MGLDMYLEARVSAYRPYGTEPDATRLILDEAATKAGLPEISGNIDFIQISREVAYWRKANQIHQWFVVNAQEGKDDCSHYYVGRDQLSDLRALCAELLASRDGDDAAKRLPPQSGFFFGSTDIDEWYWQDLENTVNQIDKVLATVPESAELYYHSSW